MTENKTGEVSTVISRRKMIESAAAATAMVASAGLLAAQPPPPATCGPSVPPPGPEPHADLFLFLTFWVAATNGNPSVNSLDPATIKKIGLDPSSKPIQDMVAHVQRQKELYSLIRQEFTEVAYLYSRYGGVECPAYAEALSAISNLPKPK